MTENDLRPGIFIQQILSYPKQPLGNRAAGMICGVSRPVENIQIEPVQTPERAQELLGENADGAFMAAALLENANTVIHTVLVERGQREQYREAVQRLLAMEAPYCILSDWNDEAFLSDIKKKLESGNKLFVLGGGSDPIELAKSLNSPRMLVASPPILAQNCTADLSGSLLAGILLRQDSLSSNLVYETVSGTYTLSEALNEEDKQSRMAAGICVFEQGGLPIELIRGFTSMTTDSNGQPDFRYRNIGTVSAMDAVVLSLSAFFKEKLRQSARLSMEAIASLAECELIARQEEGLISSYEKPLVLPDPEDSSACTVQIGFTVIQSVTRIFLALSIAVNS